MKDPWDPAFAFLHCGTVILSVRRAIQPPGNAEEHPLKVVALMRSRPRLIAINGPKSNAIFIRLSLRGEMFGVGLQAQINQVSKARYDNH